VLCQCSGMKFLFIPFQNHVCATGLSKLYHESTRVKKLQSG